MDLERYEYRFTNAVYKRKACSPIAALFSLSAAHHELLRFFRVPESYRRAICEMSKSRLPFAG
jgi:hypothetical protein